MGQHAYAQLDRDRDSAWRQLDALRGELVAAQAAREKAEAEREESKRLEGQLRKAGGKFKEQVKEKERELDDERTTKAGLAAQLRSAFALRERCNHLAEENASLTARAGELASELNSVSKSVIDSEGREVKENAQKYMNAFMKANEQRKKVVL